MKKIGKFLILLVMLLMDFALLITVVGKEEPSQLGAILALPLSLAVPSILGKVFHLKFNDNFKIVYYIFVFLAQFLGSCCNFYDTIGWYDNFTHFLSGIFSCYIGMYILNLFHFSIKKNLVFNCFFLFGMVSLIAISWEFIEFGIDNILKMNMQHAVDTGVADTMFDMLFAFSGSILFHLFYIFEYLKKKDGFIMKSCQELC